MRFARHLVDEFAASNYPIGAAILGPILLLLSPFLIKYIPRQNRYTVRVMKLPRPSENMIKLVSVVQASFIILFGLVLTIEAILAL